jgi:acyl carrier protein
MEGTMVDRERVLNTINLVLKNKARDPVVDDDTPMREAGLRSLDFSEVAVRLEDMLGRELNFEASAMRRIATIRDVIDFFVEAAREADVNAV